MKFRLVWVGSDDDGGGQHRLPEDPNAVRDDKPHSASEQRDGAVFRRERLKNGRLRLTQLTNFSVRIVGDIVHDHGEQQQREFGIEARAPGRSTNSMAFPLPITFNSAAAGAESTMELGMVPSPSSM